MSEILSKIFNPAVMPDSSQIRDDWRIVAKGAALYAAMAIQAKDWVKTQQALDIREKARQNGGLDAALLAAIFGGEIPQVPDNRLNRALILEGHNAKAGDIAEAEAVIAAYLKAKAAHKAEAEAKAKIKRAEENRAFGEQIAKAQAETEARRASDIQTVRFSADFSQDKAEVVGTGEKVGLSGYATKNRNFYALAEIARHHAKTLGLPSNAGALPVRFAFEVRGQCTYKVDESLLESIKADMLAAKAAAAAAAAKAAEAKAKAEKEARLAALIAAGAIIVDEVILTEDGQEILMEEV